MGAAAKPILLSQSLQRTRYTTFPLCPLCRLGVLYGKKRKIIKVVSSSQTPKAEPFE
jgi:hypothetical protein